MSMPICMKLAAEPMSDLGLAFYFGLGFSLFVFWGEQRGSARILFAVGSALGFALGTKYNALLAMMMFLLCMVSFLQRWNFTLREVARSFGIVIGVAVILYLPWPIKNFWYTGNPFYPFAEGIFGVSDELPFFGSVRPIPYRMGVYREDWREIVLIPLRMMFTGLDDIPSQFDGLLSPILLCAFATLLSLRRKDGRSPWMMNTWLLVVSYHVLSLSLFYALVRYQAPLLVPIVSLCSCGLALIGGEPDTRRKRIVFRGVFAFQLLWAGWYGYRTAEKVQPFGYWLGNEARETFLQRRSDEYNTARFVNVALPDDAVVYLLFTGNRYYLYDRQVRGSYFSQQPIVRCLGEEATAEHLSSCLRAMGISHIALHTSRTRKSLDVSLSSEQKVAWTDFAKRFLELAYQDQHGAHTVWRLRVPENST